MEYNIEGLTKKQVALLDIMWTLKEPADVENFVRSLPKEDALMARSLMTLLLHEVLEEWLDGVSEFPEAMEVIESIR